MNAAPPGFPGWKGLAAVAEADINTLLQLVGSASSSVAHSLTGANWLTLYGVEIRYPGDTAEMLPGDEARAIHIVSQIREVVLAILSGG